MTEKKKKKNTLGQLSGSKPTYMNSGVKPFLAPEEAAYNLMNWLRWCHSVAKVLYG